MIASTLTFAVHVLVSSFRFLAPVKQVLDLILPYATHHNNMVLGANSTYNTKHYSKGDVLPPFKGKLRLYNMRFCPFAHRVILVLNAKKIDYEVINIDLMNKPEWLQNKSALGKVPALEIKENLSIYESLIVSEYVDEAYPQRPLLPKDPVKRAFDKILIEVAAPILTIYSKIVKSPDTITKDVIADYIKALEYIQNELKTRGTKFLGGQEPGYVDYMIWPWFEKLWMLQGYDERVVIDNDKFKLLVEYIKLMFKDPAVELYLIPVEALIQILQGYRPGNVPPYDILVPE